MNKTRLHFDNTSPNISDSSAVTSNSSFHSQSRQSNINHQLRDIARLLGRAAAQELFDMSNSIEMPDNSPDKKKQTS
jgi:hypothetical protein